MRHSPTYIVPHCVQLSPSVIFKKNTANILFIYIPNRLLLAINFWLVNVWRGVSFGLVQRTFLWLSSSLRGLETICWLSASTACCQIHLDVWNPSGGWVSNGPTWCLAALPDVEKSYSGSAATSLLFLQRLGPISWNTSPNHSEPVKCVQKVWKHGYTRSHCKCSATIWWDTKPVIVASCDEDQAIRSIPYSMKIQEYNDR